MNRKGQNDVGLISVKHGSDMTSPLVDPEGFPRADIDVVSAVACQCES